MTPAETGKKGKPLKVFLLGVSFNTRNMGVGALTASAIKCVKHSYPDSEVCILDYGKKSEVYNFKVLGRDTLVRLVNMRFSKKIYLVNNIALLIFLAALARLMPLQGTRRRILNGNRVLNELSTADLAASLAGGDSFSDIYGIARFFYVALPQLLVLIMGKPLIQLPQTIGPFKHRVTRFLAKQILSRSSHVYSRDYPGLLEAREILGIKGEEERLKFCFDVAFALDPAKPASVSLEGTFFDGAETASSVVGLNVSGLLYMGGYTGDNMFGLKLDYRLLISKIIDFLVRKKNAHVILVPHVFGGKEHPESDSEACRRVYRELKPSYGARLSLLEGSYDQCEIKHIIGQCDFFIGSRMHACIAAVSQGIPAVPIAYSRKFKGVMESIGIDSHVADPCMEDADCVIGIIDRAYEDRAAIATKLKKLMPEVRETVLNVFREVPA